MVFLRGVKFEDLAALVKFIYLGEVTVEAEHVDSFFSTARDLEIKGLVNEKHSISKIEIPNQLPNEVQNEMEDEDSDDHNIAEYIKYRTKLIEDQTDLNAGPSSSKGPLHFLCGQCDSSFANKATLQHHINSQHLKSSLHVKFAILLKHIKLHN